MAPPLERALEKKIQQSPIDQKAKILTQQNLWPELLTARDILNLPPDPTRWIWDRCLPVGGCSLLVAKPKVGKSTFAVCLALSVARGMTFLNRETQQGPVAYLSLDASLQESAELFLSFGLKETDPVFFHAGTAPKDAVTWIMHRIKQNGVKLVIIDTLQRLFRFQNINDYSEVTNTIEPLLDSARQENCHVMLTHHAKKESLDDLDASVGSTALRGMFYQYLHIKKLPDSDRRIFRTEGRGGLNFQEYALAFDKDGFLDLAGTREDVEIQALFPTILEFLSTDPETTQKEIMAAIQAKRILVSKAINELFKANEIERTGKGKKGDPFKYFLTTKLTDSVPEKLCSLFLYRKREDKNPGNSIFLDEIPYSGREVTRFPSKTGIEWEQKGTESEKQNPGNSISQRPTPLVDKLLSDIEKEKK